MIIERYCPISDYNCSGDYYEVWVKDGNTIITKYGDYYHDKGRERAEAFLQGILYATRNEIQIAYTDIADLEGYN